MNTITGISLGPGDPDLITVKGLNTLKAADRIYFPGSLFKNGRQASYSQSILDHYGLETSKLVGFYLKMDLAREQAKVIYEETFQQIKADYEAGLSIAIVSEGDISTFSSFSYLLEKIQGAGLPVALVPGITSYSAAAAENLAPLCLQNDKVLILPRVQTAAELEEALSHFDTVILMKIISVIDVIEEVLQKGNYHINYSERVGTAQQFTTSNWEEVSQRKVPYFSLITIRKRMKITITGLGPGDQSYILPIVQTALRQAEVVIGYDYYFQFGEAYFDPNAELISMPLGKEEARAHKAVEKAQEGKNVVVIGSGDASIYSMAAIVYEVVANQQLDAIELETLPGISAFLAAGSKLGAPLGHDFCCISLSDLMTPWNRIEKRIRAAAMGDFVTSLYNPKSKTRHWQLGRLQKLFLEERSPDTPVAIIRHVTRPEEDIKITTLGAFDPDDVDMFCLVMIGNSQTFQYKDFLVTPRGYLDRKPHTGKEIQQESFRIVTNHIGELPHAADDKWAMTRIIHTTGVLEDHAHYNATPEAITKWHDFLKNGGEIVTDVTMVKAGITRAFTENYGNQVHCLLNEEESKALAQEANLTRSQAGIRKAIEKHPNALYVVGNAPTALFEIVDQIKGNAAFAPAGVIGVPVGFVNVIEAKEQLSQTKNTPWVIVEGNRGGSNVAAAITNAAFTLPEAAEYFN